MPNTMTPGYPAQQRRRTKVRLGKPKVPLTLSVAFVATPTVVKTFLKHYLTPKSKRTRNPAMRQLSYEEAVSTLRTFLHHVSHYPVESLQSFTSGLINIPQWVHVEVPTIPNRTISKAADYLINYLGPSGVKQLGGEKWWQWRSRPLTGEWIEMVSHHKNRTRKPPVPQPKRILLYVHGGAYFFNSVGTERYQIQRHARKLNCRAFAVNYRLAPQFPFPCAFLDALAAYIYLLDDCEIPPNEILISGDSSGGGLVLALLCLIRDVGLPLPAGSMLISPWVDLLHSFPSIVGDDMGDYIPNFGFHHKPSLAWPPPTAEDLASLRASITPSGSQTALPITNPDKLAEKHSSRPQLPSILRVNIDGEEIEVRDQIQMIAPNELLDHPLISPVTQASLGGLCPLLILAGGAELLRDEIIYTAHKAAQPSKYPTAEVHLGKYPNQRQNVGKYPPTKVFFQIYDGCAHVTPTFSFTKPAKYMYRAIANFGIWCTPSDSQHPAGPTLPRAAPTHRSSKASSNPAKIYVTGTIPDFEQNNMIRQRVATNGIVRPMEPEEEMEALRISPEKISVINSGPTKRWLQRHQKWEKTYQRAKRQIQAKRAKEYLTAHQRGFVGAWGGEMPPPSALAGRPSVQMAMKHAEEMTESGGKNMFAYMWGWIGGSEDREHEEKKDPESSEEEEGDKKVEE